MDFISLKPHALCLSLLSGMGILGFSSFSRGGLQSTSLKPKHKLSYFLSDSRVSDVYVSDLDGKNRIKVTKTLKSEDQVSSPQLSPNGHSVAFVYHLTEAYLCDIATGQRKQATHIGNCPSYMVDDLAFSPDSKRLAASYSFGFDGPQNIAIFDIESGRRVELAKRKIASEKSPVFSHQGTLVAYLSNLKGSKDGSPESLSRISDSADSVGPNFNLYLSDSEGISTRQLTHGNWGYILDAQFSPDDQTIWFSSSLNKVCQINLKSGATKQLFDGSKIGAPLVSFALFPDGKGLLLAVGKSTKKYRYLLSRPHIGIDINTYLDWSLKRMDFKTGRVKNILTGIQGEIWHLQFSKGSNQLFFNFVRHTGKADRYGIGSVNSDGTGFCDITQNSGDCMLAGVS